MDVLDALGSPKKVALPLNEILQCRFVDGPFPTLVVETVGLCHYLGFADDDKRDAFATALSIARSRAAEFAPDETTRDPRDAFILKPPSYKQARLVLNARRLSFDLVEEEDDPPPWARARNLLRRLAAASPDAAATAQAELFDPISQTFAPVAGAARSAAFRGASKPTLGTALKVPLLDSSRLRALHWYCALKPSLLTEPSLVNLSLIHISEPTRPY